MKAVEFRQLIEDQGKLAAAKAVNPAVQTIEEADAEIFRYVSRLLYENTLASDIAAAIVLWGTRLFDARPNSVRRIWRGIRKWSKVLLMGAGGQSKSYGPAAWFLLDWWRDPEFTNIKLISTTSGHAKSNTYSTMVRLHRAAVVRMPGEISSDYIGLDSKERKSGIEVMAIPQGDDGKARLQGFHPDPRPKVHPKLGPSSRVRAFLDECEKIPSGLWSGVDNMLLSMEEESDVIKIVGAHNPADPTTITALNEEPQNGWESFDIDRGVGGKNEWLSRNNWHVIRIDGRYTENVLQKKLVYPGFMTYAGYRNLELKDGGNSISFYTFGRGAYPPEGAVGVLISSAVLNGARGEYVFLGSTINVAGVDTAVDGRDNCIYSLGRCGLATAFKPSRGPSLKFAEPRRVIQVDQQFSIKKGSTKIVGDGIISTSTRLNVSPEFLCIDATGNGSAVYSYVKAIWSMDVQGLDFNKPASNTKILSEDQRTPEDLYEGVVSEVWFAAGRLMEFNFVAVAPGVRRHPFESELLSRRYVIGAGKKLRVEKKDDYKLRMGSASPDYADSFTILIHAARTREHVMGTMMDADKPTPLREDRKPVHGLVDQVTWFQDSAV